MYQISDLGQKSRKEMSPDGLGSPNVMASQDPRTTSRGDSIFTEPKIAFTAEEFMAA
jgi:hypothetical protein